MLIAATMKSVVFWDVMLCAPKEFADDSKEYTAWIFSWRLLPAGYLPDLLLDVDDKGTMFLRNVPTFLSDYILGTTSQNIVWEF
jgi:hypothetical protein